MTKVLSAMCLFVALGAVSACGTGSGAPAYNQVSAAAPQGSSPVSEVTSVTVNGTVKKSNIDGCSYLLCAVDNNDGQTKCFIPQKMDPALLQDGNVVTASGVIRKDVMTVCMAGPVLQVQQATLQAGAR